MSLIFECHHCESPVRVYTDDWAKLRKDKDGTYPRHLVHAWLGERVMTALTEHVKACPKAEPGDDGRPNLRLVVSR